MTNRQCYKQQIDSHISMDRHILNRSSFRLCNGYPYNDAIVAARTHYGVAIDAAVQCRNVIATQFHPEKSGKVGLQMLRNFVEMTGR